MKKIFLLTILLFQLTIVFGQNAQWDNWQAVSCYKGFQTSSISYGFNKYGNGYEWNWKVKSNYNKKVSFNLAVTIGSDKKDWGRFTLSPGDEHKHVSFYYNNASPNIKIEITKVCFSDNYLDNCWAECDNGTPNQPNCDKKTISSNSSSSSNTTTTKQNDLSEYNRSKADLEKQMNDKNAEGQQKSQNYTTAMNAGISAHNSGNYNEAKRQFSIALNNCNTEEARRKAQEYYNKSVDAEKSQSNTQTINTVTNVVTDLAKNIKVRKWDNGNLVGDNELFNDFTKDVIIELEKAGFKYSSLDNTLEQNFVKSTELNNTIIERKRKLYFYYNDKDIVTANIKSNFISLGNATCFEIKLDYHNDNKITEILQNNNPFKKFKSAYGKMKYDYERKELINYTSRINQIDVEIFKQDHRVQNIMSKLERPNSKN